MRHHRFTPKKRDRTKRAPRGIKAPKTREAHKDYALKPGGINNPRPRT